MTSVSLVTSYMESLVFEFAMENNLLACAPLLLSNWTVNRTLKIFGTSFGKMMVDSVLYKYAIIASASSIFFFLNFKEQSAPSINNIDMRGVCAVKFFFY